LSLQESDADHVTQVVYQVHEQE